jgi:ketosteroid isomerase-like protein
MMMDTHMRRLTNEIEITRLIAAYSHAVMRLDAAGSAAVYTEDGVLSAFSGPDVVGREKIERMLGKVYAPLRFLSQNCGSIVVDVEGDTARASSSVSEFVQYKDKDLLSCCFGNYDDNLVRTSEGWRFARRRFNPFFSGTLRSEGTPFAPSLTPHLYAPYPPTL